MPLPIGAARLSLGNVVDANGEPALRVFAASFDTRLVLVYDPDARQVEATIRTGRGPQAIAFDDGVANGERYALMIVAHFTDSYLGVVTLDARRPRTYGAIVSNVGLPTAPKELSQ